MSPDYFGKDDAGIVDKTDRVRTATFYVNGQIT